jgi:RNA polymerase sigma-70 factor (ECF subfamily)
MQSLGRLITETCGLLARVARRTGVRECDVDDVVQRAYVTFARRAGCVLAGKEHAFLVKVTRREAGHQRRGYRRRRELAEDEHPQPASPLARPDVLARRKEARARVFAILETMDEPLRAVLVAYELEQRTLGEIAAALGIPVGTVKSRLSRARCAFAEEALQRFSRSSVLCEEES